MVYKPIKTDFLLNKITKNDFLFNGNYTIDPYQNCEFGCLYCDSSFDKTIKIKINSAEILEKEISQAHKGTIIVGSVHDPYQKAEEEYKITRNILKIILKYNFSCHILTKSDLILRDVDILRKIKNCNVTISLISLNDSILNIFEKNVINSKNRLKIIEKLNKKEIKTGAAILPIIPFLVEEELEDIIKSLKNFNAQYILHKYLELKGNQKDIFINILKENYPDLLKDFNKLYKDSYMPNNNYINKFNKKMNKLCFKYNIRNSM